MGIQVIAVKNMRILHIIYFKKIHMIKMIFNIRKIKKINRKLLYSCLIKK